MEEDESYCHFKGVFFDQQLDFFYMHHLTYRTVHTMAPVTPEVENWLEQKKIPYWEDW